jgi:hypothetical protein
MKALKRVCVSVLLVFFRVQLLNPLRYIYFGIYTLVLFSTLSMIAGSDRALRQTNTFAIPQKLLVNKVGKKIYQ